MLKITIILKENGDDGEISMSARGESSPDITEKEISHGLMLRNALIKTHTEHNAEHGIKRDSTLVEFDRPQGQ